jgi:hypothetical protein
MDVIIRGLRLLRRFGQKAGPYLMLEILMPGGTLLALLLFLYQRRSLGIGGIAQRTALAFTRTLASMIE